MNLLHAPSDVRRSRRKAATYIAKCEQLVREVQAMRDADPIRKMLDDAIEAWLEADGTNKDEPQ